MISSEAAQDCSLSKGEAMAGARERRRVGHAARSIPGWAPCGVGRANHARALIRSVDSWNRALQLWNSACGLHEKVLLSHMTGLRIGKLSHNRFVI